MVVLGRVAAAIAVAAAASASPVAAAPTAPSASLTSLEAGVVADINALRAKHHLAPLRVSAGLTLAARAHSDQMAADGYFAHESADGSAFWRRLQSFWGGPTWQVWSVGENLLWRSPDIDPGQALRMWLASPRHRANMLDPAWREIGISAVHVSDGPGVFAGAPVTIVTTDFGVRR